MTRTSDLSRADLHARPQLLELAELLRDASTIEEPALLTQAYARWFGRGMTIDLFVSTSRRDLPVGDYKITRRYTADQRPEPGQPNNPWRDWHALPTHRDGFLARIMEVELPQLITPIEIDDDPVLGNAISDMRACLAIPHFDGGQALNWAIQFARDPETWDLEALETALLNGNLLGSATRNLVTRKRVDVLNRKLEAQLDEMARVQRSLLPETLPEIPGCRIATSYLTSQKAGGDYYDFIHFGGSKWGIMVADVSGHGHGPAAATVMAMLHAFLHGLTDRDLTPARSVEVVNERLTQSLHQGMFVTAAFVLYDADTGDLEHIMCGHPPPRVRRADGRVEPLVGEGALPMGIVHPIDVVPSHARLEPGDTLVLYTDGITEAARPMGGDRRELFGEERFTSALLGCSGEPSCVIDSINDAVNAFTGVSTRDDDQTLLVLQRLPEG